MATRGNTVQSASAAARDDRCAKRRVSDSRPPAGAVETSPTEHPQDVGMLSVCRLSENGFSLAEWHCIALMLKT